MTDAHAAVLPATSLLPTTEDESIALVDELCLRGGQQRRGGKDRGVGVRHAGTLSVSGAMLGNAELHCRPAARPPAMAPGTLSVPIACLG